MENHFHQTHLYIQQRVKIGYPREDDTHTPQPTMLPPQVQIENSTHCIQHSWQPAAVMNRVWMGKIAIAVQVMMTMRTNMGKGQITIKLTDTRLKDENCQQNHLVHMVIKTSTMKKEVSLYNKA